MIALGSMRAWLDRSRAANLKADTADVADFFESFPFDWQISEGRLSRTSVFYLWAWRWQNDKSVWHFAARRQLLKHALNKDRDVSMPAPLRRYLDILRTEELKRKDLPTQEPENRLESEDIAALRNQAATQILRRQAASELLQALVTAVADLDLKSGAVQRPLLSICAFCGTLDDINFLLDQRASANAEDAEGRTALHYAARRGDVAALRALLSAGADPMHASINGATPAAQARLYCTSDKLDAVRDILVEYGYLEDARERWLWQHRKMKDRNDEVWRRELEDVEMYPLPR